MRGLWILGATAAITFCLYGALPEETERRKICLAVWVGLLFIDQLVKMICETIKKTAKERRDLVLGLNLTIREVANAVSQLNQTLENHFVSNLDFSKLAREAKNHGIDLGPKENGQETDIHVKP